MKAVGRKEADENVAVPKAKVEKLDKLEADVEQRIEKLERVSR